MERHLRFHLIAAFLFGFGFIAAYWAGLPTDFNSDHITINLRGAEASSYGDLIQRTLNPLSPAWFYPSDRKMEYLRPLQFLWMKLYFDLFGDSLLAFHFTAAVGFGLLAALFFFLIYRWTKSKLYGWLAVILYLSFPSNYYTLTSTFSGDFQPYISILTISALLLFVRLTTEKSHSLSAFLLKILGCIVLIWLAIKLKSSEKILPFVCLGFLFWKLPTITARIGRLRWAIALLATAAMLILVIPSKVVPVRLLGESRIASEQETDKDNTTFNFHWKNMLQRTFYVPGGEFPFTVPYRQEVPRSFSENLGFPLAWLFWLNLILLLFVGKDRLPPKFWILLIWFAATVAGFANGLTVLDTRFLNFAYVPGILLLFMGLGIWEERFNWIQARRLQLRILLMLIVLYSALFNYAFYTGLARHFGGMQWAQVEAQKDIFRSREGREPADWELYLTHSDLHQRLAIIDWYNLPPDWFEEARQKLINEGMIFFFARHEDSERLKVFRESGYAVELWKRYDFYDAPTLLIRSLKLVRDIKKKIRGKAKKHEILVYRIKAA